MFRSFFTTIFRGSSAVLCAVAIPSADLRSLSLYYYAVCGRMCMLSVRVWCSCLLVICLFSSVHKQITNRQEHQTHTGATEDCREKRPKQVGVGQSARMLWMKDTEFYLGLCCTEWHWVTSFLLCMVFAYHSFSKNSWYLYEVLVPSTVYKLKIKSAVKWNTKETVNEYVYVCKKISCLYFICRLYLNMPEMFIDRATGSNYTKRRFDIKTCD